MDPFLILPLDVVKFLISSCVDDRDILSLHLVNKLWNKYLCNQIQIWDVCIQEIAKKQKIPQSQITKTLYEVKGSPKKVEVTDSVN